MSEASPVYGIPESFEQRVETTLRQLKFIIEHSIALRAALQLTVASLDQLLPHLPKVPADIGLLNKALTLARPLLETAATEGSAEGVADANEDPKEVLADALRMLTDLQTGFDWNELHTSFDDLLGRAREIGVVIDT